MEAENSENGSKDAYFGIRRNRYSEHVNYRDDWRTPPKMFQELQEFFGRFKMDLAADHENAHCKEYFTKEMDGLACDWPDELCFCNPPFGKKSTKLWVAKFHYSRKDLVTVLPAVRSTKWYHQHVRGVGRIFEIEGRVAFLNEKGEPMTANQGETIIVRYGPTVEPGLDDHVFKASNWR